jgi:hypothetical protein
MLLQENYDEGKQHDALFSPHYSGRMTQVASTTMATTLGSGASSYGFTNEYQDQPISQ